VEQIKSDSASAFNRNADQQKRNCRAVEVPIIEENEDQHEKD
jgi:hypothetical protein